LVDALNDEKLMEVFELQAELCKSLADPKRLMIIHELVDGAKSVNEIAERLGLKQSNASQHLAVLRKAGVIVPDRKGNTIFYSLLTPKIASACDMVREVIAERLQRNQILTNVM
jgi:ArsR family transcriptional regulator